MKIEVTKKDDANAVDWSIFLQILQYKKHEDGFKVVYIGKGLRDTDFEGVVLTSDKDWKPFERSDIFSKSMFKPFDGVITLQND